jgi:hypothetical protein
MPHDLECESRGQFIILWMLRHRIFLLTRKDEDRLCCTRRIIYQRRSQVNVQSTVFFNPLVWELINGSRQANERHVCESKRSIYTYISSTVKFGHSSTYASQWPTDLCPSKKCRRGFDPKVQRRNVGGMHCWSRQHWKDRVQAEYNCQTAVSPWHCLAEIAAIRRNNVT